MRCWPAISDGNQQKGVNSTDRKLVHVAGIKRKRGDGASSFLPFATDRGLRKRKALSDPTETDLLGVEVGQEVTSAFSGFRRYGKQVMGMEAGTSTSSSLMDIDSVVFWIDIAVDIGSRRAAPTQPSEQP